MPSSVHSKSPNFYCLSQTEYHVPRPSACDNLLRMFGLNKISESVARFDPVTGEKKKLRKSYKGHIQDLPGKHTVSPGEHSLLQVAFQPPPEGPPVQIRQLDTGMLNRALNFEKTGLNGIPGADAAMLAVGDAYLSSLGAENTFTQVETSNDDGALAKISKMKKKRKRKKQSSIDLDQMTPTSDNDLSVLTKRRKTEFSHSSR